MTASKHPIRNWGTYINSLNDIVIRHMFADGQESHEIARCKSGIKDARLIAAAPDGYEAACNAYLALLRHPHDEWRVCNQQIYCDLRDYIAKASGTEPRQIQESFEAAVIAARASHE